MLTFVFKLGKDVAFKCNAQSEDAAWEAFSIRKQLTVEFLKTQYKIKKI